MTIYRGVDDPKYGISWILDKKVAKGFANQNKSHSTYVYECIVDKKEILCYLDIMNEKEVI